MHGSKRHREPDLHIHYPGSLTREGAIAMLFSTGSRATWRQRSFALLKPGGPSGLHRFGRTGAKRRCDLPLGAVVGLSSVLSSYIGQVLFAP
jgi:hypothetical protein